MRHVGISFAAIVCLTSGDVDVRATLSDSPLESTGFNSTWLLELKNTVDSSNASPADITKALNIILGTNLSFSSPAPAKQLLRLSAKLTPVDWYQRGFDSPVQYQGRCESCWAFSAAGAISFGLWKASGQKNITNISVQQLVDCDHYLSIDKGCKDGSALTALLYVQKNGGIMSEADYPYTDKGGQCLVRQLEKVGVDFVAKVPWPTFSNILPIRLVSVLNVVGGEAAMAQQIQESVISVCVASKQMHTYESGLVDCGSETWPDHCVLLVGLHTAESVEATSPQVVGAEGSKRGNARVNTFQPPPATSSYWIFKNSWGHWWGDGGYGYIEYGKNKCGIAMIAVSVVAEPEAERMIAV